MELTGIESVCFACMGTDKTQVIPGKSLLPDLTMQDILSQADQWTDQ